MRVDLGAPRHGWMNVALDLGDVKVTACASNVLNDPVEELIQVIRAVQERHVGAPVVVRLWEEPAGYILEFDPTRDASVCVAVWRESALFGGQADSGREVVARCRVAASVVAHQIRLAVTRWVSDHRTVIPEHWSRADYRTQLPPASTGIGA